MGVNSIPELELMLNSNSGIGIAYLKNGIGIEVSYKTFKSTN